MQKVKNYLIFWWYNGKFFNSKFKKKQVFFRIKIQDENGVMVVNSTGDRNYKKFPFC